MGLPAVVHTADGDVIGGMIANMSSGGAFVTIPADCAMLRGLIELEFTPPAGGNGQSRRPAYVIHQRADGVGVIFDDRRAGERLPRLAGSLPVRPGTAAERGLQEARCR
jgi:hypothetical protein